MNIISNAMFYFDWKESFAWPECPLPLLYIFLVLHFMIAKFVTFLLRLSFAKGVGTYSKDHFVDYIRYIPRNYLTGNTFSNIYT